MFKELGLSVTVFLNCFKFHCEGAILAVFVLTVLFEVGLPFRWETV